MQSIYQSRGIQILCLLLLLPALGTACGPDDPDAVVHLCGNLSVPDEIDSLRVVITDQDNKILREGVRELWTCPGPSLKSLPQTLKFAPVQGDVFVRVQGIRDGAPVIENTLRTTLSDDDNRATISLEQGCMGIQCAPGETCSRGECELVALATDTVSSCNGLSAHADSSNNAEDTDEDDENEDASSDPPGADLCADPGAGGLSLFNAPQNQTHSTLKSQFKPNGIDADEAA